MTTADTKSAEYAKLKVAEATYQSRHSRADIDARGDAKAGRVTKAKNALDRADRAYRAALIEKAVFDDVLAERTSAASTAAVDDDNAIVAAKARAKRKRLEAELAKLNSIAPATPPVETAAKRPKLPPAQIAVPQTPATAIATSLSSLTVSSAK